VPMGPASIGGVPGCLRPARPPLIQIDIAGVHRSRSPSCSGRGSGCPGSGVGQRDESTSPARPSRQVGRALPDGTSAVSAPAARILAAWLSVAPVSNRCTGHRLETCATLWLRPMAALCFPSPSNGRPRPGWPQSRRSGRLVLCDRRVRVYNRGPFGERSQEGRLVSARRRLALSLLALVGVFLAGTAGYMALEGAPLGGAAYMTLITLSTVGYGESLPLDGLGRLWTSAVRPPGARAPAALSSAGQGL